MNGNSEVTAQPEDELTSAIRDLRRRFSIRDILDEIGKQLEG